MNTLSVDARRLAVIGSGNFLLAAGICAPLPLLVEVQKAAGLRTSELGLIAGAAFLGGLLGQLGLARLADRGHTRVLLVTGLTLAAVGLVWFGVARGFWGLLGARFLLGLGDGCFIPAARATVAALDADRVGVNMSRLSAAELSGVLIGPVLAVLLADNFGLTVTFLTFGIALGALVPLIAGVDLGHVRTHAGPSTPFRSLIGRPGIQRAALLYMAMYLPVGAYDVLWARYLHDRGGSSTLVAISFVLYSVPYIVLSGVAGRTIDRIGAVPAALIGLTATLPILITYGLTHRPWVAIGMAVVEGSVHALALPGAQAAMVEACAPGELGAGQGISGAAGIGGAGVAAVVCAPLYEAGGAVLAFGVVVAAVGFFAVAAVWLGRSAPLRRGQASSVVRSVSTDR